MMLRQMSSRNQKSKGFKLKKALQICLLLIVSVWLLYQVKHYHDKKRAYRDSDSHMMNKDGDSQHDTFKFGRKDLPTSVEPDSTLETRTEEEENKESEQDTKHEEDADDANNEHDQDNIEDGAEHREGDSEAKEKDGDEPGVSGDEENKERVNETREESFQSDNAASAVAHNSHEIQVVDQAEKPQESDDPSSLVIQDTQVTEPDSVNVTVSNSDEDHLNTGEKTDLDSDKLANRTVEGPSSNGSSVADEHGASNSTSLNSHEEQQMNSATVSNNQMELLTNPTDTGAQTEAVSLKNDTSSLDSARAQEEAGSQIVADPAELNKNSSISSNAMHNVTTA